MGTLISGVIVGLGSIGFLWYRLYRADKDKQRAIQLENYIGADAEAKRIEDSIAADAKLARGNDSTDLSRL